MAGAYDCAADSDQINSSCSGCDPSVTHNKSCICDSAYEFLHMLAAVDSYQRCVMGRVTMKLTLTLFLDKQNMLRGKGTIRT
jgi:hypothetical protein